MTEADILRSTYQDICRVYRPAKSKVDGETIYLGGTDGDLVYADIPCALSSRQGGKAQGTATTAKADADYTLFVSPEVCIEPHDTVVVYCMGFYITATAGVAMRYGSHNNVPLNLQKDGENE